MKMNMIPRSRMIHTDIWNSEQFTQLDIAARVLYIGMITIGDDEGRFKADARFLNGQIFPYDKLGPAKVAKLRDQIQEKGLINLYTIENTLYGEHPNWFRYQKLRPDRTKPSKIPPPLVANPQPSDNQMSPEVNTSEANCSEDKKHQENMRKVKESWKNTRKKLIDRTYESQPPP